MITINLQVKEESPATRVKLGELPSSRPGKLPTDWGATSGQHPAWWSHILLLILPYLPPSLTPAVSVTASYLLHTATQLMTEQEKVKTLQ